jgi:hypothetical protein
MPPKFTPPEPADVVLLHTFHHLNYPGQQAILADFAAGEIGVETTAYLLIQEAKERFPTVKAAIDAAAYERATRARELREMAENEKAAGPTFVEYTPEGRPVNEPAPLPPGALLEVPAPSTEAAATPAVAAVPAEVVAETPPAEESAAAEETEEASGNAGDLDDSDWQGEAAEQEPDFDE